ncbi:hypothetical protein AB0K60_16835 [Thermopolyspora sp. NPDC052614]|uniref:hypothetical protein n=1 Tax=Thermopolyspora sp. NPDC052614 TaxID=3155682 RepID=UPI00344AC501
MPDRTNPEAVAKYSNRGFPAPAPGRHPAHRPARRRDVGPDALAEHCAGDGRYEFLLVAAPPPIIGAVGSPVNPITIK